jgi:hypothetical protein
MERDCCCRTVRKGSAAVERYGQGVRFMLELYAISGSISLSGTLCYLRFYSSVCLAWYHTLYCISYWAHIYSCLHPCFAACQYPLHPYAPSYDTGYQRTKACYGIHTLVPTNMLPPGTFRMRTDHETERYGVLCLLVAPTHLLKDSNVT